MTPEDHRKLMAGWRAELERTNYFAEPRAKPVDPLSPKGRNFYPRLASWTVPEKVAVGRVINRLFFSTAIDEDFGPIWAISRREISALREIGHGSIPLSEIAARHAG